MKRAWSLKRTQSALNYFLNEKNALNHSWGRSEHLTEVDGNCVWLPKCLVLAESFSLELNTFVPLKACVCSDCALRKCNYRFTQLISPVFLHINGPVVARSASRTSRIWCRILSDEYAPKIFGYLNTVSNMLLWKCCEWLVHFHLYCIPISIPGYSRVKTLSK